MKQVFGANVETARIETLLGQRNPLWKSVQTEEVEFIESISEPGDDSWDQSPLLKELGARGFVCIPIPSPINARGSDASLLAISRKALYEHNEADLRSYDLLAKQVGIALDHIREREQADQRMKEVNLLLDYGRQLTSLDPGVILQKLLESALGVVPHANAGMVLRWKSSQEALIPQSVIGYRNNKSIQKLAIPRGVALPGRVFEERASLIVPEVNIARDYNLPYENLMLFQEGTKGRIPISSLIVPIQTAESVFGTIVLDNFETPDAFNIEDQSLVGSLAQQTALILENTRLLEQTQVALAESEQQATRLRALNKMSEKLSRAESLPDILKISLQTAEATIANDRTSLAIFEPDLTSFTLFAVLGSQAELTAVDTGTDLEKSAIQQAVDTNQLVEINESAVIGFPEICSVISVPLVSREQVMGTINVGGNNQNHFTIRDQNLLTQIASLASATIDNKQLLEQTQELTAELEERVMERTKELEIQHTQTQTLLGIMTELSASLDLDIVLNRTLGLINKITGAENSSIILSNPADASLLRRASLGYTTPVPQGGQLTQLAHNEGLAGWVITNREAALIPDIQEDARWVARGKTNHRSAMVVPLLLGAEALGALMLFHRDVGMFSKSHLELIDGAAKQIAVAVNNAQLYELIRDQAERLGGMLRNQQIEASRVFAILEAVADGVLVTDANGEISIFNPSAEKILDIPSSEVTGRGLEGFIGLFGKAGHQWIETIQRWSVDPENVVLGETFSEQITLENDRVIAVNLAPVVSPHDYLGTVSIFRDITRQIEVDQLKSEFVATVSHELRTPMTSIKGYVDILLMGAAGELGEQQLSFLRVVQDNTERLNILVNDLLEVSRIDAGRISLSLQRIQIQEIVRDVITDFQIRSREEEKEITMRMDVAKSLPSILGDPERVRQIIENLISNAYAYTPTGGSVIITMVHKDGQIETEVKDTGVGIPPEEQERIFERFYRGEAPLVSTVAGTGLGLSIVQNLIELHKGTIRVESSGVPGDGSKFLFSLPLFQEEVKTD